MKIKSYAIIISSIIGAALVISGVVMAFKGLTSTGVIDIKSALLSGKIESGSLGLFFAFLGIVLLIVPILKKHEKKLFLFITKKQMIKKSIGVIGNQENLWPTYGGNFSK